jgi:hypothetical protein
MLDEMRFAARIRRRSFLPRAQQSTVIEALEGDLQAD